MKKPTVTVKARVNYDLITIEYPNGQYLIIKTIRPEVNTQGDFNGIEITTYECHPLIEPILSNHLNLLLV